MIKNFSPIIIILSILICIYLVIYIVSKIECLNYRVREFTIERSKCINNVDIVFISDFHNKRYKNDNIDLINHILKLNPDYIILGGDFIDFSSLQSYFNRVSYKNTVKFIENLTKYIKDNKGKTKIKNVFFGFGNHELRLKERKDNEIMQKIYNEFIKCLNDNDVIMLNDETITLYDNMTISGINLYKGYYRNIFSKKPNIKHIEKDILDKYFAKIDTNRFNIMAFHKPDYFEDFADYGFDLVLSGHNHGGLIRFPKIGALFSPDLNILPKYNDGIYKYKNKTLIVSAGLGEHFVKLRVNNRPDICLIRIHGKDNI